MRTLIIICVLSLLRGGVFAGGGIHNSPALVIDTSQIIWKRSIQFGESSNSQLAIASVHDPEGNIVVTGTSDGPDGSADIITTKYDQFGNKIWEDRYDGPARGYDLPHSIHRVLDGSFIIIGSSKFSDSLLVQAIIIKYSAVGTRQWITHHLPIESYDMEGLRSLVGSDGEVILADKIYLSGYWHSRISKYNTDGSLAWVFVDTISYGSIVESIAGDDEGNVYATGAVWDSPLAKSILAAKLASSGQLLWYSAAQQIDSMSVTGLAVTSDLNGGAYIVGEQGNTKWGSPCVEVLRRYNSLGHVSWERQGREVDAYARRDIAFRVTGPSSGFTIAATFSRSWWQLDSLAISRFDNSGSSLLESVHRLTETGYHYPVSMKFSESGNLYLASKLNGWYQGSRDSVFLAMFDTSGNRAWTRVYAGPNGTSASVGNLSIDQSENVHLVGSTGKYPQVDGLVLRYDAGGSAQWSIHQGGPGANDVTMNSVVTDADGNSFIVGQYKTAKTTDIFLCKMNALGEVEWIETPGDSSNQSDYANHIALDPDGDILFAGVRRVSGLSQYLIGKISAGGEWIWTRTYMSSATEHHLVSDIAVDNLGSVYVAGGGGTVKFANNGDLVWSKSEYATAIAVDQTGNVYVGESEFRKYRSDGSLVWSVDTIPSRLWIGGPEIIYMNRSQYYANVFLSRYDTSGNLIWSRPTPFSSGRPDFTVDDSSNIYITSHQNVVKIAPDNSTVYSTHLQTNDYHRLWVDSHGFAYVATMSYQAYSDRAKWKLTRLSPDGSIQWEKVFPSEMGIGHDLLNVGFDADGSIYVADRAQRENMSMVPIVYKLRNVTVGVDDRGEDIPLSYSLEQNYPNPFNPVTTIGYSMPERGRAKLVIFDVLGRQIKALVDDEVDVGRHTVRFDAASFASGVYFYRIDTPGFSQTRKLLLLR